MSSPTILYAYTAPSNVEGAFPNEIINFTSNTDAQQGVFIGYPVSSTTPYTQSPLSGAVPTITGLQSLPNGVYLTGTLTQPDQQYVFEYSNITVIEIGPSQTINIFCSTQGGGGGGSNAYVNGYDCSPTGGGSGGYGTPITIKTNSSFEGTITISILVLLYNDSVGGNLAESQTPASAGTMSSIIIGTGDIYNYDYSYTNLSALSNIYTINIPYNQNSSDNSFLSNGLISQLTTEYFAGYAGAYSINSQITPNSIPIPTNMPYSINIGDTYVGGAGGFNGTQGYDQYGIYNTNSYYHTTNYPDNTRNGYLGYTIIGPMTTFYIGTGGASGGNPGSLANYGGGNGGGAGNDGYNGTPGTTFSSGGGGASGATFNGNGTGSNKSLNGGAGYPGFCMIYV